MTKSQGCCRKIQIKKLNVTVKSTYKAGRQSLELIYYLDGDQVTINYIYSVK